MEMGNLGDGDLLAEPGSSLGERGSESGTLDLLLQCCNACTWTNIYFNYKTQRNYKQLRTTMCMPLLLLSRFSRVRLCVTP